MTDPKAAAAYSPGDAPVTRPDLDALIARLREWADHQDVPAPASNAIDEAVDALAAERARADQAEQRIADAPHDVWCDRRPGAECNCWKSPAPTAEQGATS